MSQEENNKLDDFNPQIRLAALHKKKTPIQIGLGLDLMYNRGMKKVLLAIVLFAIMVGGVLWLVPRRTQGAQSSIIATNFVSYDFARAVIGKTDDLKMLLKPGSDAHDFEPSPQDLADIEGADLFIYIGGESEKWIQGVLDDNNIPREKVLRLMDVVEIKEEEVAPGMESEDEADSGEVEYDEHIWTSPVNAIKMVKAISEKVETVWPEQRAVFQKNTEEYIAELKQLDRDFRDIVAAGRKKELIFGDRFPFRYFVDEYGLGYYAAFPGCSEQTEASSATTAFLIDKIKKDGINIILKLELSAGKLAQSLADETGAEVLEFAAAHNISEEDFAAGVTYLDIMNNNKKVLEKALR